MPGAPRRCSSTRGAPGAARSAGTRSTTAASRWSLQLEFLQQDDQQQDDDDDQQQALVAELPAGQRGVEPPGELKYLGVGHRIDAPDRIPRLDTHLLQALGELGALQQRLDPYALVLHRGLIRTD